jgi:hypothetical protein
VEKDYVKEGIATRRRRSLIISVPLYIYRTIRLNKRFVSPETRLKSV